MYAHILTDINNRKLDRLFTYRIPASLRESVVRGSKVRVPFSGRTVDGYVVGLSETTDYSGPVASVQDVVRGDLALSDDLIDLAYWLASESFVSLAKAFDTVFPSVGAGRPDERSMGMELTQEGIMARTSMRSSLTRQALDALADTPGLNARELTQKGILTAHVFRRLKREDLVRFRRPRPPNDPIPAVTLTPDQEGVLRDILSGHRDGVSEHLIHGVTGSGKTQIYFRLIQECLREGRQAMILFPEIALTQEMISRFKEAFGERVRPWHSAMSRARKKRIWDDLGSGAAQILIGPRSASLVGMKSLGLVIIDEEHDASYIQNTTPCYDGREAARYRAHRNDALLVLGSATPSLRTLKRVAQGTLQRHGLEKRYFGAPLPHIEIVDMRAELSGGNYSMFSRTLKAGMEQVLREGQCILLFLNRRGYSGSIVCRDCGHTLYCKHCDIPMTYHKEGDTMKCHYCGYQDRPPVRCPRCGSKRIRSLGIGTQKVEDETKKLFPQANVARIDGDIGRAGDVRKKIVDSLKRKDTDILIGTQMITKGIDFPDVGLVGVLAADLALNMPDYNASETACQQLIQVAGRAGRSDAQGRCIIQTYQPEHPAITMAREERYLSFAAQELEERKALSYPPFAETLRVVISSEDEAHVSKGAVRFSEYLTEGSWRRLGPVPATYSRIRGQYRWHVILIGDDLAGMRSALSGALRTFHERENTSRLYFTVEHNPSSML